MPGPGDRLYRIIGVRFASRQSVVQVEYETFVVDSNGVNVPTGMKAVRVPWNQDAFDAAKSAISAAAAAEPTLAGFTEI